MFLNERAPLLTNKPLRDRAWAIIGNPDCRRVAMFQQALAAEGEPAASLLSYADLLSGKVDLRERLTPGTFVRIESAAECWSTRSMLIEYGYEEAYAAGYPAVRGNEIERVVGPDSPEFKPRQLYLGYRRLLREIEAGLSEAGAIPLSSPADIACMFDKWECQQRLVAAGVPVPAPIVRAESYEQVRAFCGPEGRHMLKMAHGSGGVGCVALHFSQGRVRAFVSSQTLAMVAPESADMQVPVQRIDDEVVLAQVIDALCTEQAHIEPWLAKDRFEGKPFDLRVVVIAGQARHAIARLGRSPFTNLNLGGERREIHLLEQQIGRQGWKQIEQIAGAVARCFPQSLCFGLDLLLTPSGDFYVVEVNAFGDLLLNVLWEGKNPYAAEIAAMDDWLATRDVPSAREGVQVA